ncbi:hypothetical protein LguiB_012454 [Lonicera macranthoides]
MNLSFLFSIVMVKDMLDLNKDLFELDDEETIAVHSSYLLSTMISRPDPFGMSNEALFFYGSVFDSLEDCMDHGNPNRRKSESIYYSRAIENIVAAKGEERTVRQVNISVWRKFFVRFGMMELARTGHVLIVSSEFGSEEPRLLEFLHALYGYKISYYWVEGNTGSVSFCMEIPLG